MPPSSQLVPLEAEAQLKEADVQLKEAAAISSELGLLSWALPSNAGELRSQKDGSIDDLAAAQCVAALRNAAVLVLLLQGGIFALSKFTSYCVHGSLHSASWVLAAALPALAARFWIEWFAVKYLAFGVAASYMEEREKAMPFCIMGKTVKFQMWLAICAVFSLLNFADIATDSLFVARSTSALTCGQGDRVAELWQVSWRQSLPGHFGIPAPDLSWLIIGCGVVSLLQVILPLVKMVDARFGKPDIECYRYTPLGRAEVHHADLAFDLAEASGMVALQKLQFKQVEAYQDGVYAGGTLLALSEVVVYRVLLSWFAENALQLNLQTTLFVLTKRASRELDDAPPVQYQALLSIVVGLLSSLVKLAEALDFFKIATNTQDRLSETELKTLRGKIWCVRIGCVAFVAALLYAAAMLIGAFVCEDSVLNITGCAALDE